MTSLPEARARVAEFLRQWNMPKSHNPDVVYGVQFDPDAEITKLLASDLQVLLTATSSTLLEVKVHQIARGDQWLLDGAWVKVTGVEVNHPDDRVQITYAMDGEEFSTSEFRGFEDAVVKR